MSDDAHCATGTERYDVEDLPPSWRPKCPDCGDVVRIKLTEPEDCEREYSYTHCGRYWTFSPDMPTANEVMKS